MAPRETVPDGLRRVSEPEPTAAQRRLLDDTRDDHVLRLAFVPAVVAHLLALVIQLPSLYTEPAAAEQKPKLYRTEPLRFRPPPPQQEEPIPKPRARTEPMPDPTPDGPEPIRVEEPEDFEVPIDGTIVIDVPEAPPVLEPRGPIPVAGAVSKPEKVFAPPPRYPEIARRARIQGIVILQATINVEGGVDDVVVLKGQPMGLTAEAVEAVRRWKFEPARLNGRPVAVYFNLMVHFEIE